MSEPETDSDSETPVQLPPSKRRRIIDPSAVTTVPVYSSKVSTSLQLKPSILPDSSVSEDAGEPSLWPESQAAAKAQTKPVRVALSDSEEEPEGNGVPEMIRSPSPPPPQRHTAKTTRRAKQKIKEINRKLNAIDSLLSPVHDFGASAGHHRGSGNHDDDDDDIILVSDQSLGLACGQESREIQLKFRCRTDLYKIPMQPTAPLRMAVHQLSEKLRVPPARILLLRRDSELPVDRTPKELGLGIADIIECVVIEEEVGKGEKRDMITVRLQGKEKGSSQDYSLHKDAPLGSILSQYLSRMTASSKSKVCFLFDGSKVGESQTPSQLDMEDGDVIEVWA